MAAPPPTVAAPAADDHNALVYRNLELRDQERRRKIGIGLWASGSVVAATSIGIVAVGVPVDEGCGFYCMTGLMGAGIGGAMVVAGAVVHHRAKRRMAILRNGRVALEWIPGRGVRF